MKDLIEALPIFLKYGNPASPTNCQHDELWVDVSPELVSEEDLKKLDKFFPDDDEGFSSFRSESC